MNDCICRAEGCENLVGQHGALGLCPKHYERWHDHGRLTLRVPMNQQECSVSGCSRKARTRGMCGSHYNMLKHEGAIRPFKYVWHDATEEPCEWCGDTIPQQRGRSRFCSVACQSMAQLWKGRSFPTVLQCTMCGQKIPVTRKCLGQHRRRVDRLLCPTCKAARCLRHKFSVRVLANRDGSICGICHHEVDLSLTYPDPLSPSVDHIIPLARGGANAPENFQLAHLHCNVSKQARLIY